jgi:hypothetical protein
MPAEPPRSDCPLDPPRLRPIDWRGWLMVAWVAWFGWLYARMVLEARGQKLLQAWDQLVGLLSR